MWVNSKDGSGQKWVDDITDIENEIRCGFGKRPRNNKNKYFKEYVIQQKQKKIEDMRFLDCASKADFSRKYRITRKTLLKVIEQLKKKHIEITIENILKQRDENIHNSNNFRQDRKNKIL